MSTTMDELSAELKQKTQTAVNTIEFLKIFFKVGQTGDEYQKVGQIVDDGTPSNFIFTGKKY